MHTKAMSTGVSLASCCASVTCSARTGTENSATSLAWVTRRPCFLMCSTCSGQGSMNVTSSPACTIWAPAYPPTAPAPTIAIFRPMLSSRHSWQPRLARRPGSSQRLNRSAPGARRHSLTSPRSSNQQFRLIDHTKQHFPGSRNAGALAGTPRGDSGSQCGCPRQDNRSAPSSAACTALPYSISSSARPPTKEIQPQLMTCSRSQSRSVRR